MGQAIRIMSYDRAGNEANAIPVLSFGKSVLHWHRLDDGVMGGQSETLHKAISKEDGDGLLHFVGQINTNGGGFASIRSPLPEGSITTTDNIGVRITFRGDGKTYKLLLSDVQSSSSPFSRSPSWQADIPTKNLLMNSVQSTNKDEWQTSDILFNTLKPSFGGSALSHDKYEFDASSMRQIGLMLSLKLSDASPNPKETFGEGKFPFSFIVKSVEPITTSKKTNTTLHDETCTSGKNGE